MCFVCFFFFKQKTAYEVRISDGSSDVCSSDLTFRRDRDRACRTGAFGARYGRNTRAQSRGDAKTVRSPADGQLYVESTTRCLPDRHHRACPLSLPHSPFLRPWPGASERSEEHTSELQSLMRISYAVFCLKKK